MSRLRGTRLGRGAVGRRDLTIARILVIDDDDRIREMVQRVLASRGHVVDAAENGSEALASIGSQPPDLVVTDIFMPGRNGIETLLALRERFPDLKVIAMSGGDASGLINLLDEIEALGASWTLPKPFTPAELIRAVNHLLREPPTPSP